MPRFFTSQLATQGVSIQQAIQAPPPPLPQIITPLMTPLMTPLLPQDDVSRASQDMAQGYVGFPRQLPQVPSEQQNEVGNVGQIQRQAKPRVTRRQASRKRPYEQIIQF
ncbi:MULE transposase [Hirsutella rhossiliensis]